MIRYGRSIGSSSKTRKGIEDIVGKRQLTILGYFMLILGLETNKHQNI